MLSFMLMGCGLMVIRRVIKLSLMKESNFHMESVLGISRVSHSSQPRFHSLYSLNFAEFSKTFGGLTWEVKGDNKKTK